MLFAEERCLSYGKMGFNFSEKHFSILSTLLANNHILVLYHPPYVTSSKKTLYLI